MLRSAFGGDECTFELSFVDRKPMRLRAESEAACEDWAETLRFLIDARALDPEHAAAAYPPGAPTAPPTHHLTAPKQVFDAVLMLLKTLPVQMHLQPSLAGGPLLATICSLLHLLREYARRKVSPNAIE